MAREMDGADSWLVIMGCRRKVDLRLQAVLPGRTYRGTKLAGSSGTHMSFGQGELRG